MIQMDASSPSADVRAELWDASAVSRHYSRALRVLACAQCGAPIEVSPSGGAERCGYCQAENVLQPRDEGGDHARAAQARANPISESERFAKLRHQVATADGPPPSLRRWLHDGTLAPQFVDQARHAWTQTHSLIVEQARSSGQVAFGDAERFFYLTLLLVPHLQTREKRALVETAAELLDDARHRDVCRSLLARLAAQHGELDSAEEWLSGCNPRPTDLVMDTAYRLATATMAAARGDGAGILACLGQHDGDVPIASRSQRESEALRIHAVELRGAEQEAESAVRSRLNTWGAEGVRAAFEAFAPLELAPNARQSATQDANRDALQAESDTLRRQRNALHANALEAMRGPLRVLPILALILLIPISVTRCSLDADPFMGVYGKVLCPEVCVDCQGRVRVVTVWRSAGAGEWTSNGAQYFCSTPANDLTQWTDERIEMSTGQLASQEMSAFTAFGATLLLALLLVAPLFPLMWSASWRASSERRHRLERRIQAISTQLGVRAPPSRPANLQSVVVSVAFPLGLAVIAVGMVFLGLLAGK